MKEAHPKYRYINIKYETLVNIQWSKWAKNGEKKVIHDSLINWTNITFMKNVEGGLSCNKSTKAII